MTDVKINSGENIAVFFETNFILQRKLNDIGFKK